MENQNRSEIKENRIKINDDSTIFYSQVDVAMNIEVGGTGIMSNCVRVTLMRPMLRISCSKVYETLHSIAWFELLYNRHKIWI